MNKAVFLDRDGVINHPKRNYYVYRIEDFKINSGVIEALLDFQDKDYLLFVVTNQGGISKGKYTAEDVEKVHAFMDKQLRDQGIYISAIFFCPHHPSKENCLCRKPKPLMLEKAMAQFDVDPGLSWFIGDKKTDVEAGIAAGLKTIKVRKNQDLRNLLDKVR